VLADATTGEVLAAKKAHRKRRPASTIKTLTALTLLPKLDPEATWIGTARAANTYGSKVGIKKGREYTIDQLFYGLMLPSGNDAAIALAQANSTVPKTVDEMNEVAQELQAYNTTAANTSGLDAKGQFSTAYDLTLIARAALEREDFRTYATTKKAQFPNPKKKRKKPIDIYNQNDLVMDDYRGAVGVKTGYTSKAGRTFIGAAQRDGRTLIVALMGIREPSDKAAKKLLNWGFRNRDAIVPIGELVDPISDETVMEEGSIEPAATAIAEQPTSARSDLTAAPGEPTLSSLSPTAWGWLAVFTFGVLLVLVSSVRWLRGRKQRRLIT
jgi:D-alanyl-D-alanine carboxypeptidase (penicillin-binding protein 5/6)